MPTTEKLRTKLLNKLTELFQLDQPDLDFGFYRIMQAKAQQVKSFIDKDLLQIIEDAFGQVDESRKAELAAAYEKAIQTAEDFGAPNPEETEPVKKAKAALDVLKDGVTAESDVYDHLYHFFERYYDEGDFISRRYYARENAGKAAPFAIPYNGEEVKLHWANADQYYIKTTEYFSNYSFDITQAVEIRKMPTEEKILNGIADAPLKIHFRIVEASEGEHGNVKAAEDKKRFFILYEENPVELNDANELVINFEYKELPSGKNEVDDETEKALKEKFGVKNKGDMPNLAIAGKVIEAAMSLENAKPYIRALSLLSPTEKIPNRPLLAKYINQYTARNTCDYFIHKDLNGFLKRELDFYIKNEVMHLDDIENAEAPAVEGYLSKLKVIRKIASKLIEFLAQIEDFQKKLWLKKKFVTETNYCITLDRVPEELYEDVAANDSQREEWVRLFAINEIKDVGGGLPGIGAPNYSVPLTPEFLKVNDKLVLDTAFFSHEFKARLVESIEDFDEQCDGLLIHSENFQALNLLQERYREQVKCMYIDPPYNTNATPILYKNEFKSASWLSLLENRLSKARECLIPKTGFGVIAIDDHELININKLLENVFSSSDIHRAIVNHYPGSGTGRSNITRTHEYALFVIPKNADLLRGEAKESGWRERGFCRSGTGENNYRSGRPNSFYAVLVDEKKCEIVGFEPPPPKEEKNYSKEKTNEGYIRIYPLGSDGSERCWTLSSESALTYWKNELLFCSSNMIVKRRYHDETNRNLLPSVWVDKKYSAVTHGTNLLTNLFGDSGLFSYPKSLYTVETAIESGIFREDCSQVLDYFSGSGTTGHAVINLNRNNGTTHKYILVEMGDYFSSVTKPRIAKVIYSSDWRNGKPTTRDTGISNCFKYLRLESYEDTLNNLVFDENSVRNQAIEQNAPLREDYMLHYMLDVETRGSQSLLNIDNFADPTTYTLKVKKPGSDEQVIQNIDLIETFNYLIGLRVIHLAAPQTFAANFTRKPDPELPEDQHTKLVVNGKIQVSTDGK